MDQAFNNQDAKEGVVYITTFNDRRKFAERLVDVLPAMVEQFMGKEAREKWIQPTAFAALGKVTWLYDEDNHWTGQWETADDADLKAMLGGKIGNIDLDQFHIEGMELLNSDDDESVRPMLFESANQMDVGTAGSGLSRLSSRISIQSDVTDGTAGSSASGTLGQEAQVDTGEGAHSTGSAATSVTGGGGMP